ncbi:MAG: hypothetical protein L6Q57_00020 [Alphaproteobacteria bacterium]|nr:hypothetical protein [Alphaproteobacteria bacterium]
MFPLWSLLGFGTALASAGMMLLQERWRVDGYALAFWIKATCVAVTVPFVILYGLPDVLLFYVYLFLTAILYAISDVVFYSGITKSDAGAVSRLVPSASVLSFLLWFMIDPALLDKYLQAPVIAALIFITLCLFSFFALRLKKCVFTMDTLRAVWFVIFAATVGPVLTKMITLQVDMKQAIYATVFLQAAMMMGLWLVYLFIKKPVPLRVFFAPGTVRPGMTIGLVAATMVILKFTSYYFVDNPAYIPAMIALDSVIILLVYRLWGKRAEGDIASGLGIVACAVALIILKAQV